MYFEKYLKYKQKYLSLKDSLDYQKGGAINDEINVNTRGKIDKYSTSFTDVDVQHKLVDGPWPSKSEPYDHRILWSKKGNITLEVLEEVLEEVPKKVLEEVPEKVLEEVPEERSNNFEILTLNMYHEMDFFKKNSKDILKNNTCGIEYMYLKYMFIRSMLLQYTESVFCFQEINGLLVKILFQNFGDNFDFRCNEYGYDKDMVKIKEISEDFLNNSYYFLYTKGIVTSSTIDRKAMRSKKLLTVIPKSLNLYEFIPFSRYTFALFKNYLMINTHLQKDDKENIKTLECLLCHLVEVLTSRIQFIYIVGDLNRDQDYIYKKIKGKFKFKYLKIYCIKHDYIIEFEITEQSVIPCTGTCESESQPVPEPVLGTGSGTGASGSSSIQYQ
jgi:hypothetical protein